MRELMHELARPFIVKCLLNSTKHSIPPLPVFAHPQFTMPRIFLWNTLACAHPRTHKRAYIVWRSESSCRGRPRGVIIPSERPQRWQPVSVASWNSTPTARDSAGTGCNSLRWWTGYTVLKNKPSIAVGLIIYGKMQRLESDVARSVRGGGAGTDRESGRCGDLRNILIN